MNPLALMSYLDEQHNRYQPRKHHSHQSEKYYWLTTTLSRKPQYQEAMRVATMNIVSMNSS